MMGDQNDKQRRFFWSFMDERDLGDMTRVHAATATATSYRMELLKFG